MNLHPGKPSEDSSTNASEDSGGLRELVRRKDWSKTPLGAVETWSPTLKTIVEFLLANRFPILLWWGPQYISIYNDAYRPILGTKHPNALGLPFTEVWSEIADVLLPLIDAPFNGGPATWMDDIELELNRYGFVEETHFTIAYSPVPDDTAPRGIGGVIATVNEITEKIIGERRIAALRDLSARAGEAKSAEEACAFATAALATHAKDIPFAAVYLREEEDQVRLVSTSGIPAGNRAAQDIWPFTQVLPTKSAIVIENLGARLEEIPAGPFPDPPHTAVLLPIRSSSAQDVAGFLVVGVSPRLRLDNQYRSFLDLVAAQISTTIANARAYEEERKRAEALAEIDRAKTLFFSNVSHEFRTPLGLILGPLTDALTGQGQLDRAQIELAHRNSLRLLKLVNSLLDFSRIEAGRAHAVYTATNLSKLTADLASNFRSACERAGLNLVVDCQRLSAFAYVDRDMWEKIVLNLLSNAFKFTFEGSIEVALHEQGDFAVLSVSDTGVGIPEQELTKIFERFHRIEGQRSRTFEGSGIGLALVSELVKLHGGTLSVESKVGEGSTFTVRIPFGTGELAAGNAQFYSLSSTSIRADAFVLEALRWLPDGVDAPAMPLSDVTEPNDAYLLQQCGRVLLADDNADMRGYIQRLLSPSCEVCTVADGVAALKAIREQRPNLVLADVMMPEMDGLTLLREIRNDPDLRDLPVILLSARAGEESRVVGMEAGADDYLVKPFSARELIARVGANLKLAGVREEATAALRESEERYRALVTTGTYAVYRMSADWSQLLSLDGRGFVAETSTPSTTWLGIYVDPEDQPAITASIQRAIAAKSIFGMEHRVRRADGSLGWAYSRAVPILDENGDITEWFGAAQDVTDRKVAEEALRELNTTLEQRVAQEIVERAKTEDALRQSHKMQAIGQLTGGLAHDFNNLLAAMGGSFSLIARRLADGKPGLQRYIDAGQDAVRRAATLTQRLLAFSRQQNLDAKPVDANKLIAGMEELIRRSVGPDVEVEVVGGGGLWPTKIDSSQLESSLLNLCINARDAMMPDGGRLTIETANKWLDERTARGHDLAAGQYVAISVMDTGTGMTPEIIEKAFDPFFTTKPVGQGTGLGLSMVYGFVRQSGGQVRIYSELNKGTTICLYLPRHIGAVVESPEGDAPRDTRSGDGETVLLVDDEPALRMLISDALEESGYRVLLAENGPTALKSLRTNAHIDLLITDLGLPGGMNGRQVATEARKLKPDLKVLFITGFAENAAIGHGHLEPGMELLTKPFEVTALPQKVRELIERPNRSRP